MTSQSNAISKKFIEYCKRKTTHAEHKNNQQHGVLPQSESTLWTVKKKKGISKWFLLREPLLTTTGILNQLRAGDLYSRGPLEQ